MSSLDRRDAETQKGSGYSLRLAIDQGTRWVNPHSGLAGFTLPEVFITLVVLIGILGLMMNVSSRLRRESTEQFTRATMQRLTVSMDQYTADNAGQVPDMPELVGPGQKLDESTLMTHAVRNNAAFVRLLGLKADRAGYASLSGGILPDPWGTPYVFMPHQNQAIGLAPQDRSFFFSAGPDRKFLTKDDNLYGYEQGG